MPTKRRPQLVSLREWYEQRLGPDDLLESKRQLFGEETRRSDWGESVSLVPLPNPAKERYMALVGKWREDCAGGAKVWASRGAADAASAEVKLSPTDWWCVVPNPTLNTMLLPNGAVGPSGRRINITWFNVNMATDVVEALERFAEAHPGAGYHQTEQAIMEETGATQRAVRTARGKVERQRKRGRPKTQQD
jgi:hypothetical protein